MKIPLRTSNLYYARHCKHLEMLLNIFLIIPFSINFGSPNKNYNENHNWNWK